MTSDDLTPEQLDRLRQTITRNLRFLIRLTHRMERLGFPGDDPLYLAALTAKGGIQALRMAAHYASCKSGVWKGK